MALRSSAANGPAPLLPDEIITDILKELIITERSPRKVNQSLYTCALISKNWTHLSQGALYQHLRLVKVGRKTMELLAGSAALKRYETRSLSFHGNRSWLKWRVILDGCEGVTELSIERSGGSFNLNELPPTLLDHPSLDSLKTLNLDQQTRFVTEWSGKFRLQHLSMNLDVGINGVNTELLRRMVENALDGGTRCLETLELTINQEATFSIPLLQSLAPRITSLVLAAPPLSQPHQWWGQPAIHWHGAVFSPYLVSILSNATSLSHLTVTPPRLPLWGHAPPLPLFLSLVLSQVDAHLTSLTIAVPLYHLSPTILHVLGE